VLRPTCVYGPFGFAFTIYPLEELSSRRVALVNGGDGLVNPVYIDDVVDALLLAATAPQAIGEVFLVSGAEPVTWKDFYGSYERMLGACATVSKTVEELRECSRIEKEAQHRQPPSFDIPSEHMLAFYASKTVFRIDKARERLGYQPRFDLEKGMRVTETWARWAGLIP
jgi:nucleoside-diphosphate-sugar epimerase